LKKSSPNICSTSVIFKPLPKVNNCQIVEISPSLVTLVANRLIFMTLPTLKQKNERCQRRFGIIKNQFEAGLPDGLFSNQ
jgi:hypothetical protein